MLEEFKKFIMRGNVIDLAVAVVIGAAFTAIVNSLVADIITPALLSPVMEFLNVKDLENVMWNNIKYGKFLASIINFVIVGFVLFMIIRTMNKAQERMDKKKAIEAVAEVVVEEVPAPSKEEILLGEIRDLLKVKN
jgi:large conductance mechanosensitive channel